MIGARRKTLTPLWLRERMRAPVAGVKQAVRWAKRERFPDLPSDQQVLDAPSLSLPTSRSPVVSIVIPVYGKFATTWSCLQALAQARTATPFEVIVVDDASPDRSAEVMGFASGVRVHRNPENLGFIRSCNVGAQLATGEWLCLLNNDTRVTDGWLDELLQTFELHADTGMVGARLLFPDGRLQEAGGTVFRDGSASHLGRNRDPGRPEYAFVREVDYCSGACLLLRTELYRSLGGFDEHYLPAYYEDADLAFRVRQRGLRVLYQPLCRVVHYEGITNGRDLQRGVKRYQDVNREKFRERWQQTLLAEHPAPGRRTALSAERRLRPQLLVIPRQSVGLAANDLQRWRALDALGWKLSVFTRDPSAAEQLGRAGIEPLTPPYYPTGASALVGPRAASVSLLWCDDGPWLPELHELIRTSAPHVKTVVNWTDARPLDTAELDRMRCADLIVAVDDQAVLALQAQAPHLRVVSAASSDPQLADGLRRLLAHR